MSITKANQIMACARGAWQREIAYRLASGDAIQSPHNTLRGAAKKYQIRYAASFRNLVRRIEATGFRVVRTPGVRGGEYSATYRVYPA
jgi:hypothetical protein